MAEWEEDVQTIHLEDAGARIPNGASLAIGGLMGVGTLARLIDELVRQQKRHLTVIANDTASPDKGIGKLINARVVDRVIASQSQIRIFPARLHVIQQAGLA